MQFSPREFFFVIQELFLNRIVIDRIMTHDSYVNMQDF